MPCCPQVRFLARGFSVPGDHPGQASHGYRWPYGPVAIITPFNFPLEIPALQVTQQRAQLRADPLARLPRICLWPRPGRVGRRLPSHSKPRRRTHGVPALPTGS